MTDPLSQENDFQLTESCKAFLNSIAGERVIFSTDLRTIDEMNILIEELTDKVRSLQQIEENPPYKDKYENLLNEFRKVVKERDRLKSLELSKQQTEYELNQLKVKYQSVLKEKTNIKSELEDIKISSNQKHVLEDYYQSVKHVLASKGIDTRRQKLLFVIELQSDKGGVVRQRVGRQSATKWVNGSIEVIKPFK